MTTTTSIDDHGAIPWICASMKNYLPMHTHIYIFAVDIHRIRYNLRNPKSTNADIYDFPQYWGGFTLRVRERMEGGGGREREREREREIGQGCLTEEIDAGVGMRWMCLPCGGGGYEEEGNPKWPRNHFYRC
jgi:hypothetical protein